MSALLSSLIRNVLAALLGFFALPWCVDLLLDTTRLHRHWPLHPWAMAAGVVLAFAVILLRKPNWLVHTLIHEACHGLMCALLFVRVRGVRATDGRGGEVEHDAVDPVRSSLIAIAPYTVPFLLGPALIARWWWRDGTAGQILSAVVAFLFISHLVGLAYNIRFNFWGDGADLPKVGRFLALVLIACVLLLLTTATIHVLWSGGAVRHA